jgi:hypothetical protein
MPLWAAVVASAGASFMLLLTERAGVWSLCAALHFADQLSIKQCFHCLR